MTLSLIGRIEKLDGPDREVDVLIAYHTDFRTEDDEDDAIGAWREKVDRLGWDHAFKSMNSSVNVWSRRIPRYTASLDAVVALGERVSPGNVWHLMTAALKAWSIADGMPQDLARFYCLALLRSLSSGGEDE